MATQVTNYQCPACTGPLQFDAATGKMGCEYCGASYSIEEIEAMFAEKNAQAEQNMADAKVKAESGTGDAWDMSGLNDNWGEEAKGLRTYSCPACCAELVCDETTAATSCPYCGNPTVIPGQFAGMLKPDFVIPFKLKKEDAIAALKKHYEGKPLLPDAFKSANHLQEIKGVYVPFWLFNGGAEGDLIAAATRSETYRSGDYKVTETSHFELVRSGSMAFENIPVDGSTKMPDDYMDSIEPFRYDEMVPFSTAYLPGYMADKYDLTAEQCTQRADLRAENTVESSLRGTMFGYDSIVTVNRDIRLFRGEVKYALLPVWLLTTKWKDQTYLFAMNGQTGKFVGNLPEDKGKKWRKFGVVYAIAAAITAAVVLFPGGLLNLLGM